MDVTATYNALIGKLYPDIEWKNWKMNWCCWKTEQNHRIDTRSLSVLKIERKNVDDGSGVQMFFKAMNKLKITNIMCWNRISIEQMHSIGARPFIKDSKNC